MRNMGVFAFLPYLASGSAHSRIQLGEIEFRSTTGPADWNDDHQISAQLVPIWKILGSRRPLLTCHHHIAMDGDFDAFLKKLSRSLVPLRYAILSHPYLHHGQPVHFEQTTWTCFCYHLPTAPGNQHGYHVFTELEGAMYVDRPDHLPSIAQPVALRYETEDLIGLQRHAGDAQKVASLEAFCKSTRARLDSRDQLLQLSIAIEGLFDLEQSTTEASTLLEEALKESGLKWSESATEQDAKISKLVRSLKPKGVFGSFLSRQFREAVFAATESEPLRKYAKSLYEVGSKIRHGDPVSEEGVVFYGSMGHISNCYVGKHLYCLLARTRFPPHLSDDTKREFEGHMQRIRLERLENSLRPDLDRLRSLDAMIPTLSRDPIQALEKLHSLGDFLQDHSIKREHREFAYSVLRKFLLLASDHWPQVGERFKPHLSQAIALLGASPIDDLQVIDMLSAISRTDSPDVIDIDELLLDVVPKMATYYLGEIVHLSARG